MEIKNDLIQNFDKIHLLPFSIKQIMKNLNLPKDEVLNFCLNKIESATQFARKSVYYHIYADNIIIKINAKKYFIINAFKYTKKLSDLTTLGREIYSPPFTTHDLRWKNYFLSEKIKLKRVLGKENIFAIHHIGSTAIPSLTAKPIIDILLEIKDGVNLDKIKLAFIIYHYSILNEDSKPMENDILFVLNHRLIPEYGYCPYHIHVRYQGNHDEIYFRDYLLTHHDAMLEYEAFKLSNMNKFDCNFTKYLNFKEKLIMGMVKKQREDKNK